MSTLKFRNSYDIIAEILRVSQGGISQQQIMRTVRLDKRRMKVYLEACQVNGLLVGEWFLFLSLKGQNYICIYEKLMKMLEQSAQMWRQRKEWLVKRMAQGNMSDRTKWREALRRTEGMMRKSRSEKVLELLIAMSEQNVT